ncbi:MAG: choice-of-anchor D domain-containing protein [Myxococcales bacterium]|nr:choice-of-anchor D domain-containing protein [Myxococcales bacterium]
MNRSLTHALAAGLAAAVLMPACDDDPFQRLVSNDILTEPALRQDDDGIWRTAVTFDRVPQSRTATRSLTVRHGGEAALTVSRIYLEGLEACDRVTAGIAPGQPFPGELDARCEFSIDQRPDMPLKLENDAFEDVVLVYKAVNPANPATATLVIESDAFEKTRVEVLLSVLEAAPRIAVRPTTLAFPGGLNGRDFLTVRNVGSGVLTVRDYRLRLLNDPPIDPVTMQPIPEFIIDPDEELPWTLGQDEVIQVQVAYQPQDDSADNAEVTFISDDPQVPEITVLLTSNEVFSNLVVSPNPVLFGTPTGPNPVLRQVSFTNTGLRTLFVNEMTLEGDTQHYSLDGQTSFQLPAGSSRTVDITMRPRSAEGGDAQLVVRTDANNVAGGQLVVQLLRTGDAVAALDIEPLVVDMSDVAFGDSRTETIRLHNPGGLPLQVDRIAMTGADDAGYVESDPQFEVTGGGGMTTIAPDATHEVQVRFTRAADDRNLRVGSLIIVSGADTSPDVVNFTSRPPRE